MMVDPQQESKCIPRGIKLLIIKVFDQRPEGLSVFKRNMLVFRNWLSQKLCFLQEFFEEGSQTENATRKHRGNCHTTIFSCLPSADILKIPPFGLEKMELIFFLNKPQPTRLARLITSFYLPAVLQVHIIAVKLTSFSLFYSPLTRTEKSELWDIETEYTGQ